MNLVEAGDTWSFVTAADLAPRLMDERRIERRLSRAAVETLAIIAYRQPVTRADIEAIRGVQVSKGTLDVLIEQGWVAPSGRMESPGRPLAWATTDAFLAHFGLTRLADLPDAEELRAAGFLDVRPERAAVAAAFAGGDRRGPRRRGQTVAKRGNRVRAAARIAGARMFLP